MTFLELCQTLREEVRASGAGPTAVTGQTGEYLRIVHAINKAWMAIQRKRPDWLWMRASVSFTTTAGQATYTLAQILALDPTFTSFGNWAKNTFRCYTTAVGTNDENQIDWLPYDAWRDTYQFGATRTTQTRPNQFTITPALGIGLGCTPTGGYTITADYYRKPTEMAADTDEPSLPEEWHMAIVYRAKMYWGVSEAKPEIYDEGKGEFDTIMAQIERQQLPMLQIGSAMA